MALQDNTWSWVSSTCRIVSGDDTTTVLTWPSFNDAIGPWALATSARNLWGLSPTSNRFPMIGRDLGPGGKLGLFLLLDIKWMAMEVTIIHNMQLKIENSIFLLPNSEKDLTAHGI